MYYGFVRRLEDPAGKFQSWKSSSEPLFLWTVLHCFLCALAVKIGKTHLVKSERA